MCWKSFLYRSVASLLQSLHQKASEDPLIAVMLLQALAVAGALLAVMLLQALAVADTLMAIMLLQAVAVADALMAIMLLQALAVAGILLLLMTKNLAPSNVLGFCVAASNAFGLIAGIFLMGYGLVAVPRELWRTADTKNYRKMLFHRAGVQAEKAMSAHA